MRNKGLHRGADEISLIKLGILAPTENSISALFKDIGDLRAAEAKLWHKRSQTWDSAEQCKLEAEQAELRARIEALLAELERKLVLQKVFRHIIGHRATEVQREYMDPKLAAGLTHPEALLLREVEGDVVLSYA
jgi:hypothetical protein